jgi:hypothetical protein
MPMVLEQMLGSLAVKGFKKRNKEIKIRKSTPMVLGGFC